MVHFIVEHFELRAMGRHALHSLSGEWEIFALSQPIAAARRDARNADIHNQLGFACRHAGDFACAFAHYDEALRLNPRHRGAHEYAGEAALLADDLARADRHLAALEQICLLPCEELDDLRAAVAAYRERTASRAPGPRE
jgi:tetratricopeptide (TPR) repeat protein